MKEKLLLLFLGISLVLHAQYECGFDEHIKKTENNYLKAQKVTSYSKRTANRAYTYTPGDLYRIPVVVHVIESGTFTITDQEIITAIENTNKIYATTHSSSISEANGGAVIPFELVLTTVDQTCGATTGIIRYPNGANLPGNYSTNGLITGNGGSGTNEDDIFTIAPHWREDDYFNIYIVKSITTPNGVAVAGYAMSPDTNFDEEYDMFLAADVVKNPNNTTIAHEFGHALGLLHPFHGTNRPNVCPPISGSTYDCTVDDDKVCDTKRIAAMKNAPSNTDTNNCSTDGKYANTQYNIMGYTLQRNRFTPGQRQRALNEFMNHRSGLAIPKGQPLPTPPTIEAGSNASINEGETYQLQASSNQLDVYTWTVTSTKSGSFNNKNLLNPVFTPQDGAGTYTLKVTSYNSTSFCSSVTDTVTITVNSVVAVTPPTVSSLTSSNSVICSGGMYEFVINGTSGARVYYTVYGGSESSVVLDGTGTGKVTGTATSDASIVLNRIENNDGTTSLSLNKQVTVKSSPTVEAGSDVSIDEGATYQLQGSSTHADTYKWTVTSTNTGVFSDDSILNPVFTPQSGVGVYTLLLTATDSQGVCSSVTDTVTITVNSVVVVTPPTVSSLTSSNSVICSGSTYEFVINGTSGARVYYTVDGGSESSVVLDGTGTGKVTGTATSDVSIALNRIENNDGTTSLSLNKQVTVKSLPTVEAGSDVSIDEGLTHQLQGSATHADTYKWTVTSTNTGVFSDDSILSPVFTPQSGVGVYTLSLTATDSQGVCSSVTDTVTITVNSVVAVTPPTVSSLTSSNSVICSGSTYEFVISGTSGARVYYTVDGGSESSVVLDGTGTGKVTGTATSDVSIALNRIENNDGTTSLSLNKQVTVKSLPTVEAGSDVSIDEGLTHQLQGSSTHADTYKWTVISTNTGVFSDDSILNPVFTPQSGVGVYTLSLTATDSQGVCSSVTDTVTITVNSVVVVTPPTVSSLTSSNSVICSGSTYEFVISGTSGARVYYTVDGGSESSVVLDGTGTGKVTGTAISDVSILLNSIENNNGTTSLSLNKQVTVIKKPVVNAGNNAYIKDKETYKLQARANYSDTYKWVVISSKKGIFNDDSLLNPVFTPQSGAGKYILQLTASYSQGQCSFDAVSDQITITFKSDKIPTTIIEDKPSDEKGELIVYYDKQNSTINVKRFKGELEDYAIFDLSGRLIQKGNIKEGVINFNPYNASNIYVLKLKGKDNIVTRKFLK